MKTTFKLCDEFRKSQFTRTGEHIAELAELDVQLSHRQIKRITSLKDYPYYFEKELSNIIAGRDVDLSRVHCVSSLDASKAFDNILDFLESYQLERQKAEYENNKSKKERERKIKEEKKANRAKYLNNEEEALKAPDNRKYDQETWAYIQAVRKQKIDQEALARKEGRRKLKEWCLKNGSELLKLRISEDMEWVELGRQEYSIDKMKAFEVEIQEPIYIDCDEIKDANINQLKQLKAIRATGAEVKLYRYKIEGDIFEDYFEISVECPDGFYKPVYLFSQNMA